MRQTFSYTAKDRSGQIFAGTIVAENETAVAKYISDKGYFVTNIRAKNNGLISLQKISFYISRVSLKDLAVFCRQFATMLDSGLALMACLNILVEQTYNSKLKYVTQDLLRRVETGETLSSAMRQWNNVFPTIMISMVEAGETGGVIDKIFERLAVQFEKEHKLNEKVKTAMVYPLLVIGMAFMSLSFIMVFVMPTFIGLYANMNVKLPPVTRMLLDISAFLTTYGIYILFLGGMVGYLGYRYSDNPQFRDFFSKTVMRMPIIGLLAQKVAVARFSRTLGTLIAGGVPLISALGVVKNTTGNIQMVKALSSAQISIAEGMGLAAPLSTSTVFSPMVIQMISVGEETGELDKMLNKVADFYDSDIDDMVGRLGSMIEPVLIGVLGIIIGSIIIAVVMPMFDIVSNIK